MLAPDRDGLFRPANEEETAALVRWARLRGVPFRVHGSEHSVEEAIGTRGEGIDVSLEHLDRIRVDHATRQVSVGAGRRLGANPRDRTGRGTVEAGLCWQLERHGLALPVTAGVTHQTVAGFLMTGSAGGSRAHALADQVVAMRLIDGRGEVQVLVRDDERLDAAVVSMGLLGVVTEVTLQCVERFEVEGYEQVIAADGLGCGKVEEVLAGNEYARLFWWPQPAVDKFIVWAGNRAQGPGQTSPYEILPRIAGFRLPAQAFAGTVISRACRRRSWNRALAGLYNLFLPLGDPKRFRDAWWRLIPMDDELDERFFPSTYTELWFPAQATDEVIARLSRHFAACGFAGSGAYTFEIYGAKRSRWWLSPAYGRDCVRLNVCWMRTTPGDPRQLFFSQFWALFSDMDFRLHWGKHLFADPARTAARLRASYPRFDDFLELRSTMDPDGVFLSRYWREHLGIGESLPVVSESSSKLAPRQPPRGRWRWPLWFKLRPSEESFAQRAPFVIDEHAVIDASPEAIYDAIVDLAGARHWLADFVRAEWVSGPEPDGKQVVDEIFTFMTERVRTFYAERGVRWMASLDACTLPLARELMQDLQLERLPGERTQLRWRFFYEPYGLMRPLRPPLHRFFAKMVRADIGSLGKHLAARGAQAPSPAEVA